MRRGKPRLAVIGGGIAGLSLAARASRSFDVTVLEAESQPAYHSSGRSAAVAIECYENEVVRALTVPSMAFHRRHGATPIGCVTLADESHLDALEAFEAEWSVQSDSLEELPVEALLGRVPILRPERVARVLIETQALSLDAHAELLAFRRELLANGGRILCNARIERIERVRGGWRLGWGEDSLAADLLVNAAGAWGDEVGRMVGLSPLGLEPRRRTAFLLDLDEDLSGWPLVHRVQGGLYFKPEAGALMVSLADATPSPPCDAQPEDLDLAVAVERFQEMTVVVVRRLAHTWAGLRTFLPDGRPAAGFDADADGFFWLVGQGGFGIQTAPALSELAATLLEGGDHPLASAVSPARFRAAGS